MKCQFCTNQATVHLTDIVQNKKREMHLCQACAEAQQLVTKQELNLPAIVQGLFGAHLGSPSDELSRLACPVCGIGYMQFRAQGRLGCPHDYEAFRLGLLPLLDKIHRAHRHHGKSPRRGAAGARLAELVKLRQQLKEAVEAERYEDAARIRDLVREKEATDESG